MSLPRLRPSTDRRKPHELMRRLFRFKDDSSH